MSKDLKLLSEAERNVLREIGLPPELWSLFARPPLLAHEDAKGYWSLLRRVANEVHPSDVPEWIWTKTVVDLIWEICRLRRIAAALIDAGRRVAVGQVFDVDDFYNHTWGESMSAADDWLDPKKRRKVETRLEKAGLDAESIAAVSFSIHTVTLEAAERMLAAKEIRLSNTLQEIEARRERLGRLLRVASDKGIGSQESLAQTDAAE